jgi:hypothetical protein
MYRRRHMATDIPLNIGSARPEEQAYFGLAVLTVAIAFAGFFPTFWRPLARGAFHAHPIVYIHGGLFFGWTLLLALQTRLAAQRPMRLHRTIGSIGIAYATLVAVSGILVTLNATAGANAAGVLSAAASALIFPVVGLPTFVLLITLAFAQVRRSDHHQRYMLLATISALDAPVARWILFDGHESAGFEEGMAASAVYEVMIGLLALYDYRRLGAIHPATLIGGGTIVAGQILRALLGTSAWWAAAVAGLTSLY